MFNISQFTSYDTAMIVNIAIIIIILLVSWIREIDPILKLDSVYLHTNPEPVIFLIVFLYSTIFLTMDVISMTQAHLSPPLTDQ